MKKHPFGKFVRSKLFSILFIILSFFLIAYTTKKIGTLIEIIFSFQCTEFIFLIFSVYFGYMFIYETSRKTIKKTHQIYAIACFTLSLLINMVLCFLIGDAIKLLLFKNTNIDLFAFIASILLTLYGLLHAKRIYIKEETIAIGNRKTLKAAFLSDIHIGNFITSTQLSKIIKTINSLDADIVLIAGDIFNDDTFEYFDFVQFATQLQGIKPNKKVYAVLGNHDPHSTDERVYHFFSQAGIELLVDEVIDLKDFYLIGRDDVANNPNRQSLHQLLKGIERDKPIILMDHNPLGLDEALEHKVDLLLCGHTHQGQFFPVNLFTKLAYDKLGFYGYHQSRTTHIIVSSGAGYFQIPMRIGTKSEIWSLTINL